MNRAGLSPTEKLGYAWFISAVANLLAAASHGLAGGTLPHPILLGLSTALSALLILGLLHLPKVSLSVSVLASQGLLHLLFAHSGGVAHIGQEHLHHATVQTGTFDHAHSGGGTAMFFYHLLAAGISYLLIRYGELAARRTADLTYLVLAGILHLPSLLPLHLPLIRQTPVRRPAFSPVTFLATVRVLRGPPAYA